MEELSGKMVINEEELYQSKQMSLELLDTIQSLEFEIVEMEDKRVEMEERL